MLCCYVHRAYPSRYTAIVSCFCTVVQCRRHIEKRGGKTGLGPGKTDFGIGMNSLENTMKNTQNGG